MNLKNILKSNKYISIICLLLLSIIFNFLLINKFFPVTEGWFQDYARYILDGAIPYRDFYCPVPIGALWLTTALSKVFGYSFLILRYYGLIERLILISLVFFLVRKVYKQNIVLLAVMTSSIIYISNIQDVFYSYYQSSILFAFIGLYFCIKMVEKPEKMYLWSIGFGLSSGISFLMKQNIGSLFAIIIGIILAFLLYRDYKVKVVYSGLIAFGSAFLVLSIAGIYLYLNDAFYPFINQIFNGASSKGSLSNIFFSFFSRINIPSMRYLFVGIILYLLLNKYIFKLNHISKWLFYFVAGILIIAPALYLYDYFTVNNIILGSAGISKKKLLLVGIYIYGAITTFSYFLNINDKFENNKSWIYYPIFLVFFLMDFFGVDYYFITKIDFMKIRENRQILLYTLFFILLVWSGWLVYQIKKYNILEDKVKFILVVASWIVLYIHGMSGIIEDHGSLLMFSLIISAILSKKVYFNYYKNLIILVFCIGNIFVIDVQRHNLPYHWWGVGASPSIYTSKYEYKDIKLKGIKGDKALVETMNSIYDVINNNKKIGDTLYTFPHINYFNVMSNLNSPTFAKVHYFDVCPDNIAIRDAEILKVNLPSFIIWQKLPDDVWKFNEIYFRNGKSSGKGAIRTVIEEI